MSRTPGMQRRRATGGSGLSGAAASTLTPSWERPTSYHAPRGTASALYGPSADATPSAKYVNKILSEMSLDNPYLASFASDLPAEYLNPARSPASSSSSSTASVSQPYATHGAGEAQLLLGSGAMGSRIAGTSSFARPTPRPHSHHSSRHTHPAPSPPSPTVSSSSTVSGVNAAAGDTADGAALLFSSAALPARPTPDSGRGNANNAATTSSSSGNAGFAGYYASPAPWQWSGHPTHGRVYADSLSPARLALPGPGAYNMAQHTSFITEMHRRARQLAGNKSAAAAAAAAAVAGGAAAPAAAAPAAGAVPAAPAAPAAGSTSAAAAAAAAAGAGFGSHTANEAAARAHRATKYGKDREALLSHLKARVAAGLLSEKDAAGVLIRFEARFAPGDAPHPCSSLFSYTYADSSGGQTGAGASSAGAGAGGSGASSGAGNPGRGGKNGRPSSSSTPAAAGASATMNGTVSAGTAGAAAGGAIGIAGANPLAQPPPAFLANGYAAYVASTIAPPAAHGLSAAAAAHGHPGGGARDGDAAAAGLAHGQELGLGGGTLAFKSRQPRELRWGWHGAGPTPGPGPAAYDVPRYLGQPKTFHATVNSSNSSHSNHSQTHQSSGAHGGASTSAQAFTTTHSNGASVGGSHSVSSATHGVSSAANTSTASTGSNVAQSQSPPQQQRRVRTSVDIMD